MTRSVVIGRPSAYIAVERLAESGRRGHQAAHFLPGKHRHDHQRDGAEIGQHRQERGGNRPVARLTDEADRRDEAEQQRREHGVDRPVTGEDDERDRDPPAPCDHAVRPGRHEGERQVGAGAYLTLAFVPAWSDGMVAGRG
ncbi:hypothetical protein EOA28_27835, partial [Mesorhizobium sp. M2A.F.Ca.ET.067.02.1.1]